VRTMTSLVKDVMTTQVLALGGGEAHMPGMITGITRHRQLERRARSAPPTS
jgi:hypothetical protein